MTLPEVEARIAAINARAKGHADEHRLKPPGIRILPPLPDHPDSHEIARRKQCEATSLFKRHGRQLQCTARGYDMVDGHALCWVHGRVVADGVAPLLDVLAGMRAK